MKKKDEIADPNSCLNRAADDEPIFVLRAHDKLAPSVVYEWASLASAYGCPQEKCDEAIRLAVAMEKWPDRKYPD